MSPAIDASRDDFDRVERPTLAAALALSLLIHGAVAVYWVSGGFADPLLSSAIEYPDEDRRIRLGVRRSSAQTLTWLGFETPQEHSADPSVIEQAALAPDVGEVGETGEAGESAATPAETTAESQALQLVDPDAVRSAVTETTESVSRIFEISRAALTRAFAAAAREQEREREQRQADRQPDAGEPATQSESESVAVAVKEVLDVSPGKPAAAEGLEITTVRPRWSIEARLTSPRNPLVEIVFGRDGTVRDAAFTQGGTGHSNVDQPLLDAIYSWTAKGPKLEELPEREDATVTITMRILLR